MGSGTAGGSVSFCPQNIIPREMVFLGCATSHNKQKQMKSNEAHNCIMKNNKMRLLICTTSDCMTFIIKTKCDYISRYCAV